MDKAEAVFEMIANRVTTYNLGNTYYYDHSTKTFFKSDIMIRSTLTFKELPENNQYKFEQGHVDNYRISVTNAFNEFLLGTRVTFNKLSDNVYNVKSKYNSRVMHPGFLNIFPKIRYTQPITRLCVKDLLGYSPGDILKLENPHCENNTFLYNGEYLNACHFPIIDFQDKINKC